MTQGQAPKPAPVLALLASGLLAACGGSDYEPAPSPPPPPPPAAITEVPDSALASSTAYTQFVLTQSQAASESDEPLGAGKVGMPPVSESDEPLSLG